MTALLVAALIATSAGDGREGPRQPIDPPATAPRSEPQQQREWYGAPMLFLDAATLTATFVAVPRLGLAVFPLAAPIVHLAHGRAGIAAADVGIRLAMPAVAWGATFSVCRTKLRCSDDALLWALAVSMTAAALTDDLLLAYREDPSPARPSALPAVVLSRGTDGRPGAALALAGRF